MEKEEKKRAHVKHFGGDTFRADSIVLRGEKTATVYGCRRILRYGRERVCLLQAKRRVCVSGEGLICTSFSAGTVTLEGRIAGVRYCTASCPCGEVTE
ncbi:MAG: YabP/YqfC family sporulation protein [Clostridia bacterium]|nr:YabP/YqfC family sporulation protein [Clostridia bacterium]